MENFTPHSHSLDYLMDLLKAKHKGLSFEEIKVRREKYGSNIIPEEKGIGLIRIFINQFLNPLIYVLLAAAIISFYIGDLSDAIFIGVVLLTNAFIGTFQEYSANKSAAMLKKIVPQIATVIRDSKEISINSEDLVPGDIVILIAGDKIPADIRLISSKQLTIDESILTGESAAVTKNPDALIEEDAVIGERINMAYAGTVVTRGRGVGVVVNISGAMEIGRIAKTVQMNSENKPPLLIRIEKLASRITVATLIIISLLFIVYALKHGISNDLFLIAVALAVSAIPEGLPAAITIALAVGMRRMAKSNVIVRKLVSVESLGSCTLIASDKTGTLTINKLTIRKILLPDNSEFDVTGEGLGLKGEIKQLFGSESQENKDRLTKLCRAGLLANEGAIHEVNNEIIHSGDMVDIAFLILARKFGLTIDEVKNFHIRQDIIPYEPENGFCATSNLVGGNKHIFVKGSAESILKMCKSTYNNNLLEVDKILKQVEKLAGDGYRVIALAEGEALNGDLEIKDNLKNLTFLGLVGMIDPLRPEAIYAVAQCKEAGIEVVMITGDHPATAFSIAKKIGIADTKNNIITGAEISEIKEDSELDNIIKNKTVFARIDPFQKSRIVSSFIRNGHYVAVTGDGVNDAPALKMAHVGVSMGKHGTDLARESSGIILTDDNFASIVKGVKEGRVVYNNIRKVVFMVISTGISEIVLFLLSLIYNLPMPLLAVQLLWLNLVTNGVQDVALAFERAEGNELKKKPRLPTESVFDKLMLERVGICALLMGILAFMCFSYFHHSGYTVDESRNMTLLLMVLFENVQVLNSRSETISLFKQKFFRNSFLIFGLISAQLIHIISMYIPAMQNILHIKPVSIPEWLFLLSVSLCVLVASELHKYVMLASNSSTKG